jgi:hypothetical protein
MVSSAVSWMVAMIDTPHRSAMLGQPRGAHVDVHQPEGAPA